MIIVTGATGHVGSAVARRLLSQGLEVTAMVGGVERMPLSFTDRQNA